MNVCATFLVIYAVDRWGRRRVLIGGALHMLVTQIVIAGLLGAFYSNHMPADVSIVVVIFVCLFVSGHAWSWGALSRCPTRSCYSCLMHAPGRWCD